jgi:hypothetical protein
MIATVAHRKILRVTNRPDLMTVSTLLVLSFVVKMTPILYPVDGYCDPLKIHTTTLII